MNLETAINVKGLICEIARLTRETFTLPENLISPLPLPEGALEAESSVLKDLKNEGQVWIAHLSSGEAAGIIRTIPNGKRAWEMKRLGVISRFRGLGIARQLVENVEQKALQVGIEKIKVRCVVERRLLSFYTKMGYKTVARWAYPGKPLTMVSMERWLNKPRQTYKIPWEAEAALISSGIYILWLWLHSESHISVTGFEGSYFLPSGLYAYVFPLHTKPTRKLIFIDQLPIITSGQKLNIAGIDIQSVTVDDDQEVCLKRILANLSSERDKSFEQPRISSTVCPYAEHLIYLGRCLERVNPFIMPRLVNPKLLTVFR